MRVRAPEGRDFSVQIVAHRQLFACGFGVEVDQHGNVSDVAQNFVNHAERIVGTKVHGASADQIDDRDRSCLRLKNAPATTGQARQEVCRTEDVAALVQIRENFPPVPGVVSERDHVRTRVKDRVRLLRRDADDIGVFPVDHAEIGAVEPLDSAQLLLQKPKTRRAHHVAHCQHTKFHTHAPPLK